MRVFASALLLATQAAAQDVGDPIIVSPCEDYRSAAQAVAEPWETSTATFANGDVRLVLMDTIEPAGAAFHLLVLSPPYDAVGGRTCQVLSRFDNTGWTGIAFGTLAASYDPATGLTFQLEARDLPEVTEVPLVIQFMLNQATGAIAGSTRPAY